MPTLLTKISFSDLPAPFRPHPTCPDIAVNRRIRPVNRPRNQPVSDRIAPAILHMCPIIPFVPDAMLPEPSLPYPAFALGPFACGTRQTQPETPRKAVLDLAPALGVIAVAGWQCPDGMKMIRQDHNRVAQDRHVSYGRAINLSEAPDLCNQQPG